MIETTAQISQNPAITGNLPRKKVLCMVKNDRMAGSVPAWKPADTPKSVIEQTLSNAGKTSSRTSALSLSTAARNTAESEEFGFADLLDMINPMHHIPVLGHVYRQITGDTIRPISRIIGGTLFTGPFGAAGAFMNIVAEAETGTDLAGNALSFMRGNKTVNFAANHAGRNGTLSPQTHMDIQTLLDTPLIQLRHQ